MSTTKQVRYVAPDGYEFLGVAYLDFRGFTPKRVDGARELYEEYLAKLQKAVDENPQNAVD